MAPEQADLASEDLTCTDYAQDLLNKLSDLQNSTTYCDYTLVAGDERFSVHKVVLCSVSSYFQATFTAGMKEMENNVTKFDSLDAVGLRAIVDFMYSGTVTLDKENVYSAVYAASYLQVKQMLNLCERYMQSKILSAENCVEMWKYGEMYNLVRTCKSARSFVLEHLTQIPKDQYNMLTQKQLAEILDDRMLKVTSEVQLVGIVKDWMEANKGVDLSIVQDINPEEERWVTFGEVFGKIRWPMISTQDMEENVSIGIKSTMNQIGHCKTLWEKANAYHSDIHKQPLIQSSHTTWRLSTDRLIICNKGRYKSEVHFDVFDTFVRRYDPCITTSWPVVVDADEPGTDKNINPRPCIATINNFMYVCGGLAHGDKTLQVSARCYRYDPRFCQWLELQSMTVPRARFTLVVHNDNLYATGGYTYIGGPSFKTTLTCESFDVATNKWSYFPSTPIVMRKHAACVQDDYIYVSGGGESADPGLDFLHHLMDPERAATLNENDVNVTVNEDVLPDDEGEIVDENGLNDDNNDLEMLEGDTEDVPMMNSAEHSADNKEVIVDVENEMGIDGDKVGRDGVQVIVEEGVQDEKEMTRTVEEDIVNTFTVDSVEKAVMSEEVVKGEEVIVDKVEDAVLGGEVRDLEVAVGGVEEPVINGEGVGKVENAVMFDEIRGLQVAVTGVEEEVMDHVEIVDVETVEVAMDGSNVDEHIADNDELRDSDDGNGGDSNGDDSDGGDSYNGDSEENNSNHGQPITVNRDIEMYRYDTKAKTWNQCASMRHGRRDHVMASCQNQIYVLGGMNVRTHEVKEVECYSPKTDQWTTLETKLEMHRGWCYVDNDEIYVVGSTNCMYQPRVRSYTDKVDKFLHLPNREFRHQDIHKICYIPSSEVKGDCARLDIPRLPDALPKEGDEEDEEEEHERRLRRKRRWANSDSDSESRDGNCVLM